MRPVHILGLGQLPAQAVDHGLDEAEMVQRVTRMALDDAGLDRREVGFFCSGSSDYVMGRPFSFTMALDGIGPWPPVEESHVEMDGAWAAFEAWVRLQHGDVDVALAYAYTKGAAAPVDSVLTLQLDPYWLAPLAPPPIVLAALQARAMIDAGVATEGDFARAVQAARRAGAENPLMPTTEVASIDALLAAPPVATPLRAHDVGPRTDGAAAIVLGVRRPGPRISGFSHITDPHAIGVRDLADCPSVRSAAVRAGADGVDAAELHAPFSSQQVLLERVLGLGDARVNPSGGALAADSPFVTGLERMIAAARLARQGARALAHATAGPCLQHNLVCVLEST